MSYAGQPRKPSLWDELLGIVWNIHFSRLNLEMRHEKDMRAALDKNAWSSKLI
jgi:hypothetical protein